MMERVVTSEQAMYALGAELLLLLPEQGVVYLNGQLGAGKTTLVRAILQAAGYQSHVKSPTFTLVEDYQLPGKRFLHFDLYRLADPEELEWLGIRDYLADALLLIEWAGSGKGYVPEPDLVIDIEIIDQSARKVSMSGVCVDCK